MEAAVHAKHRIGEIVEEVRTHIVIVVGVHALEPLRHVFIA
jgi:hypothetical protein